MIKLKKSIVAIILCFVCFFASTNSTFAMCYEIGSREFLTNVCATPLCSDSATPTYFTKYTHQFLCEETNGTA